MNLYDEKEKLLEPEPKYDAMDLFTLASFVESDESYTTREEAWAAFLRLFKIKNVDKFTKAVQFF